MSTDFWTSSSQYGLVHKAADPPANPEALVVFVHGLFGNCRRTWGRMPQWVLEAAGLDLDVVSFSYPSRPWERAAIPQAADDLKTWLDTELQAYRHLVFVTHSSGGLVVKDLLRGAVRDGHAAVPGSDPGAALGMAADPPYHQHRRAASGRGALHDLVRQGVLPRVLSAHGPYPEVGALCDAGPKGLGPQRDHPRPALAKPLVAQARTRVPRGRGRVRA